MSGTENINIVEPKFQELLRRYLHLRSSSETASAESQHLDEDTLTAFTEGTMLEREATPTITHLVDCSFCRHRTAELIRLSMELAPANTVAARTNEPDAKVSGVLSGVLSRLFGSGEATVFAHEEQSDDSADENANPENPTEEDN